MRGDQGVTVETAKRFAKMAASPDCIILLCAVVLIGGAFVGAEFEDGGPLFAVRGESQ